MALKLENFETILPEETTPTSVDPGTEEARLAAFEKGYAAGWEDATAAEVEGQLRLRGDLAHKLQEMSFTYFEARSDVIRSLEPLLSAMIGRLLPSLSRLSLAPVVAETVETMLREARAATMVIRTNPTDAEALSAYLAPEALNVTRLVTDDGLEPGQVWIGSSDTEVEIDMTDAIRKIADAVQAFFHTEPEIRKHG